MNLLALQFAACYIFYCNADNNDNGTNYPTLINATLMKNYNRIAGPINMSGGDPLIIRIDPILYFIEDVNVAEQTLTINQWLDMQWTDPKLKWDPTNFGGIDTIMLPRSTIWVPDIVIMKKISLTALSDKLSLAQIYSNGTVSYSSKQVAIVPCQFDVVDYPYDTQNCSVQYSSWMYSADYIVLDPNYFVEFDYNENDEWTLRSYTNRSMTPDSLGYSSAFFDIKITRKPEYYIYTYIWPIFLINCLSVIGIFSPSSESGDRPSKVPMGMATLLAMVFVLRSVANNMPKTAHGVPLLAVFVILEIGLSALAAVFSVFVLILNRRWMNETTVPRWLLLSTCMPKEEERINVNFSESNINDGTNSQAKALQNKDDIEFVPKRYGIAVEKGVETIPPSIQFDENKMKALRKKWSKVAQRLDVFLMVIFLVANVTVCVCFLVIGNSKLNK